MAKGRGCVPRYVLFDNWHASLENLKHVRHQGWKWMTRLKANRAVTPENRVTRTLDEVAIGADGVVLHWRGYGLIRVFRTDDPNGVADYWASSDLGLDAATRQSCGELSFPIEYYHRYFKQNC